MTDTSWLPDLTQFPGPKYLGLSRALRNAIRGGSLPAGSQLPPVRELAWALHLTPGTVARAYQLATQEGLLAATVGRGTFVAATAPRLGPTQPLYQERIKGSTPGFVDMRQPRVPERGQRAAFGEALHLIADRVAGSQDDSWLEYTSQNAEAPLRAQVVRWLEGGNLGAIGPDDVMLTNGGQNAIGLIFDCCLRGERPVILVEELAYPGFRLAARASRAEVVAVEIDAEGIVPQALEAACQRHGPQVLCLTPEAQNPTTGQMPLERRQRLTEIAREYDLQILEDDCYAVAQSTLPSLRALAPERVWQVGSLSKTISSALRFGYVICPEGMGHVGQMAAQHAFYALSKPVAELVLELMQSGAAARILTAVQTEISDRLAVMVDSLGGFDLRWQPGVPLAFLYLPQGWRASSFTRAAEDVGVLVRSADEFALGGGRAPNAVRMAVAGNVTRAEFKSALDRLVSLLRNPPGNLTA